MVKLQDVTSILGDGLHGTPIYDEAGAYYFINGNNLCNGKIDLNENTKKASKVEYFKYKKELNERTILVSINGTLGNVALYRGEPVILGKSACYFNVIESVNKNYVRYVVSSNVFRNYLESLATGSTIKNVSLRLMRDFTFKLPPIEIQNKIADALSSLDDKITINTQNNQTLEAMAQAIFKSWFVDFDPVKAKMAVLESSGDAKQAERAAMEAISGKDEEALAEMEIKEPEAFAELAGTVALFPAAMVESELGLIPEGWSVSEIGEEVLVVGGGTPATNRPEYWESGEIHWTTPKDLSNASEKILLQTERRITEEGLKTISSGLLPINTVLMSSRAPVGYLAISKIPVAINQGYIAMKCEKSISPEYVVQWCESQMENIKQRASGTTFAEINKQNFRQIPVLRPNNNLQMKYSVHVRSIYAKIEKNMLETIGLFQIRDSLLPKLLSGDIDLAAMTGKV